MVYDICMSYFLLNAFTDSQYITLYDIRGEKTIVIVVHDSEIFIKNLLNLKENNNIGLTK